jgi:hypothetical protein
LVHKFDQDRGQEERSLEFFFEKRILQSNVFSQIFSRKKHKYKKEDDCYQFLRRHVKIILSQKFAIMSFSINRPKFSFESAALGYS